MCEVIVCERWYVTKLCVCVRECVCVKLLYVKFVCGKLLYVRDGMWQSCVCECVWSYCMLSLCVWELWYVWQSCVCECVWSYCMLSLCVCDVIVCERWYVTKLCVWVCVKLLFVKFVCVWSYCMWEMVCDKVVCVSVCEVIVLCERGAAGGGAAGKRPGIQNQKQEPHTKLWGTMIEGSLEAKLPTIWTDEKQSRAEAERRERLEERRSEKRKKESRETLCFSNDLGFRRVEK